MKRLLLLGILLTTPLYAADQWAKTEPAGTELAGTIDNLLRANNEAQDRLMIRYRRGLGVNYATAATLSVLAGEVAIPNAADSITRYRRTTAATTVTWADIDTGAEATSTTYYVYATADTDITGMVFKISTSSTAPSGMTYYRKLASFYNNSSGNIENVVNLRGDDGTDYQDVIKGWISFDGSGVVTINDSYNVSSITDNGTGDYTINWTTAFSTANYVVTGQAARSSGRAYVNIADTTLPTASSVRIETMDLGATPQDSDYVGILAIGDR